MSTRNEAGFEGGKDAQPIALCCKSVSVNRHSPTQLTASSGPALGQTKKHQLLPGGSLDQLRGLTCGFSELDATIFVCSLQGR